MTAANIIVRPVNSASNKGVKMRIVGIYAPHSDSPDVNLFWERLADFFSVENGCPERWLIAGDTNATLEPCESSNPAYEPNTACHAYRCFLRRVNGTDAWQNKLDCSVLTDWTYQAYQNHNSRSVLDQIASSLPAEEFAVQAEGYLPHTDHRPIWCDILTPVKLPHTTPGSIPRPLPQRLCLPKWGDKLQGPLYAKRVDEGIQAAGLEDLDIDMDEAFETVYAMLSNLFRRIGEEVFGVRGPKPRKAKFVSPAEKRLKDDLYHWNCYVGAMERSTLEFDVVQAFLAQRNNEKFAKRMHSKVQRATPRNATIAEALDIASDLRRAVCRSIAKLRREEAVKRAVQTESFKLKDVNRGGSVK
ncbi:hypothetical protein P7C70_g8389, partial [Phenoliferia sp. Uapishka_3]